VSVSPRQRRLSGTERRAQLIDVGRTLFAQRGYEATSMEEIAERAKVSKPILYEHFGGKEGLYAVIVDREMDYIVRRIVEAIGEGSARERIEKATLSFLTYVKYHPDGFAVLSQDSPMTSTRGRLSSLLNDLAERVGDIFAVSFKAAGFDVKMAPIYAQALVGHGDLRGQVVDRRAQAARRGGGAAHRGAGVDGATASAEEAATARRRRVAARSV
jgi:AcrR family transcriptional regulator